MKLTTIITALVVAAGSVVWADTPSTRPSTRPAAQAKSARTGDTKLRPNQIPRMVMRMFTAGANAGVKPATPQEWNDMMDFMQENSPARWHVLSTLNPKLDSPIAKDAIRKWRNYTVTRDHLPQVADQLVQRFRVEDDLFAITLTAQENAANGLDEFYDKIHAKVEKLVQLDFAERQMRIDKLQNLIEEEKAKLASDQANEEKTVDQRTEAILNRLDRMNRTTVASTTRPDGYEEATDQPQQGNSVPQSNSGQPTVNFSSETQAGGK
jgi:hypothetical protein